MAPCGRRTAKGSRSQRERDGRVKLRSVLVPPPTVPTSIEGILQVMRRSSPPLALEEGGGQRVRAATARTRNVLASMRVIQLADSTV